MGDDELRAIDITGDVVTRPAAAWTPTVHAHLRHLRAQGETGAPEPLAIGSGVETLRHIEGESGGDGWRHQHGLRGLRSAAGLLRRLHDAGASWRPPADAAYALPAVATGEGEDTVWCHGDPGPWNVVWRDQQAVALLDWDLLHAGPRRDDVAYALWWFAPGRDDELAVQWHHFEEPPDRGARVEAFVAAYDGDDPVLPTGLDWVEEMAGRAERTIAHERAFAEQGVEPQRTWVAQGSLERQQAEVAWLRAHRHLVERP